LCLSSVGKVAIRVNNVGISGDKVAMSVAIKFVRRLLRSPPLNSSRLVDSGANALKR
jgi:hypothetical protein